MKNTVTIFRETDFGAIVHEASALHNGGYYEEALEPWKEVLKRDGNYRRAYLGVASALLRQGDYKGAMKYAELADAGYIYNKAFEGYRMDIIKGNFEYIVIGAIILIILIIIIRRQLKKRRAAVAVVKPAEDADIGSLNLDSGDAAAALNNLEAEKARDEAAAAIKNEIEAAKNKKEG